MTDDPAKPPRFPYVATLLCVTCLGAATWTWMRYSYAWDVSIPRLLTTPHSNATWRDGSLVSFDGILARFERSAFSAPVAVDPAGREVMIFLDGILYDRAPDYGHVRRGDVGQPRGFVGRLNYESGHVDLDAGRFHGASIAGLVVGAMGVFVFTVALRHWLGGRREFREGTEGA